MERKDLEAIADVVKKHDLYVLSDEIYAELTYLEKHVSIASLPWAEGEDVIINGFSKSPAMTGWRLGYACAKDHYQADVKDPSVCDHVCANDQPVCSS